jgi:predicted dehydrogenase
VNVGIVGCGLIGHKRARAVGKSGRIVAVTDTVLERAERLASQYAGCAVVPDAQALIGRSDLDIVVVATTNHALAPLTQAAVEHGKHVIVEKPAARRAEELAPVIVAARRGRQGGFQSPVSSSLPQSARNLGEWRLRPSHVHSRPIWPWWQTGAVAS